MTELLASVSGVETVKVLAGAVDLPSFTIDGLARHSGVSRRTVDTVRRRYEEVFERLEAPRPPGRGRPAVCWRLRSDRVDEVLTLVGSLQGLLPASERQAMRTEPDPDLADVLITVAVDSLGQITSYQADDTGTLLSATRDALVAAGFDADGTPLLDATDKPLACKAAFVAGIADLIEAVRSNQQARIDEAQARAFSLAPAAAAHMPADAWLPLSRLVVHAPGTVLCSPLLVRRKFKSTIGTLFPALKVERTAVAPGYVQLTDSRVVRQRSDSLATSVEFVNDDAELQSSVSVPLIFDRLIFVSRNPALAGAAQDHGALFVLKRQARSTQLSLAKAVNRLASGLA